MCSSDLFATATGSEKATLREILEAARQTYCGTIGAEYDIGRWSIGGELVSSGERYSDTDNLQRMGGYTLVNLSGNYRLDNDFSLFARVNNLFDKGLPIVGDDIKSQVGATIVHRMLTNLFRERGVKQIGNARDWVESTPDVFVGSAISDAGTNSASVSPSGSSTPSRICRPTSRPTRRSAPTSS